jgi:hypothetical protein
MDLVTQVYAVQNTDVRDMTIFFDSFTCNFVICFNCFEFSGSQICGAVTGSFFEKRAFLLHSSHSQSVPSRARCADVEALSPDDTTAGCRCASPVRHGLHVESV